MNFCTFDFPIGGNEAIVTIDGSLSFDDLHRLRHLIRRELAGRLTITPKRILGCLQDDDKALLALLFLTEMTDYMPINPKLSDDETRSLAQASGADVAVVSAAFFNQKGPVLAMEHVLVWDDIVGAALHGLTAPAQMPTQTPPFAAGRLILHTSGSTGTPKRVPITIEAMNASAKNIALGHDLAKDDHALNALPTFHIGALVDVMLAPFATGGRISMTDKRAPHDLVNALIKHRPTWFQVVPTLLRRLVEDIDSAKLAKAGQSLRFIRSISAPVPADLKQQVEELFGCPVIEMYGMTETAGQIATVSRDQKGFKAHSVGRAIGVELAIMDRFGNPLGTGQTGEVCVKGPTVFEGYEGTAKDDVFFEDLFRTGDLGYLDQDGDLFLQGRLKEMINVGGEKVSPHEVEIAVLAMPDVIEAAAYTVPHPTLGEQVGLSVATRGNVGPDAIKAFLEGRIAYFKCPNVISIVNQLPRLANAKVDRVLLKRSAASDWEARQSNNGTAAVIHSSPEAKAITLHWAQILKCRTPEGDDDFFDMGGDSLSATQLLLALEKTLKREISPNQLFDAPTFSGLLVSLSQSARPSMTPTSRPIQFIQQTTVGWPGQVAVPDGILRSIGSLKPAHPLFWSCQSETEVDAIFQAFGKTRPLHVTGSLRRFKKRTVQDFEVVAIKLAEEIMFLQPDGPIVLGGYCGGAWVMHHAAEELVKRGRDIRSFISFDYWPVRELHVPTVHCMSLCEINSARINYARHDLAEGLLHRNGVLGLNVESKHRFVGEDIRPHITVLNDIVDGTQKPLCVNVSGGQTLPMAERLKAPQAKISLKGRPRVYKAGGMASFSVAVTNSSALAWEPTETSGLSLQIDLINLDGHMRKANFAYGAFETAVPAGESITFSFDVTFPDKRVPLWLSCNLVSQGLKRFQTSVSGGHKSIVFPSPFKS